MNKILTQTGGQPVYLDDINFSSEATRDAFRGLCQALSLKTNGTCVLQGCDITVSGTIYTWTDGYIALFGEIYKVTGGTITASRQPHWVVKKEKTENRTFEDKTNKQVWEISYVTLSDTYNSDEDHVIAIAVKRFEDILKEKVFQSEKIEIPLTVYAYAGISAKMTIYNYAASRNIVVEITELPEYYEQQGQLFYFNNYYYKYVKDVVLLSVSQQTFEFLMLGFFDDGQNVAAVYRNLENKPLKKGFNKITFQITI